VRDGELPAKAVTGEHLDITATVFREGHGAVAADVVLHDPAGRQPQRTLADGTAGARLHPYADLQPAGTRSADLKKFGHRSPGSAG
uniref:maltotransferase domain-containing protein n=1 Tax=Streptomyces sp. Agncl-13 TaxID=3400628 RepID=UPI003A8AEE16